MSTILTLNVALLSAYVNEEVLRDSLLITQPELMMWHLRGTLNSVSSLELCVGVFLSLESALNSDKLAAQFLSDIRMAHPFG